MEPGAAGNGHEHHEPRKSGRNGELSASGHFANRRNSI
jgi:hypothetical protein